MELKPKQTTENKTPRTSKPRASKPGAGKPGTGRPGKEFLHKKKIVSPAAGQLIAITGSIGTGKTFVLECFAKAGFEVFNADKVVHDLLKKGGKAYALVAKLFPEAVIEEGMDRTKIAEVVFTTPEKLKELEAVLHPLVREKQLEFMLKIKSSDSKKSAVFEVPLLFENKRENQFQVVIVTSAPKLIQKERVLARKGMTEEKFNAIMSKQLPNSIKTKRADFVINTGKTQEDTIRQVKAILSNGTNKRDHSRHRNNRPISKKRGPAN